MVLALAAVMMMATPTQLDSYGGWTQVTGQATGFFHTQEIGGRWWLVDPDGNVFLSIGVNAIRYAADTIQGTDKVPYRDVCQAKYGSPAVWGAVALTFLRGLGFNTIGSWSDESLFDQGMPYTIILNIAARSGGNWQRGRAADMFDPKLAETAEEVATRVCEPRRDRPQLIGYFLDNELHWGPDWRAKTTLLEEYLMMPAEAPGHRRAVEFLRGRYADAAAFAAAWGVKIGGWDDLDGKMSFDGEDRTHKATADSEDFLKLAARQYFQVCHDAIRRHDPNHLILGCREAIADKAKPIAASARGLVDVFSLSYYVPRPLAPPLEALHEASGAPVLVSEWAFRAKDSGLPNSRGAGPLVDTQAERAAAYRRYMGEVLAQPYVIGAHWFKYTDEPAEGRFDGEDSNYGLVNIKDEPYAEFVKVVGEVNAEAYRTHAGGG